MACLPQPRRMTADGRPSGMESDGTGLDEVTAPPLPTALPADAGLRGTLTTGSRTAEPVHEYDACRSRPGGPLGMDVDDAAPGH
eukprot:15452447-Alexandrium_andersonii.AAC.1